MLNEISQGQSLEDKTRRRRRIDDLGQCHVGNLIWISQNSGWRINCECCFLKRLICEWSFEKRKEDSISNAVVGERRTFDFSTDVWFKGILTKVKKTRIWLASQVYFWINIGRTSSPIPSFFLLSLALRIRLLIVNKTKSCSKLFCKTTNSSTSCKWIF